MDLSQRPFGTHDARDPPALSGTDLKQPAHGRMRCSPTRTVSLPDSSASSATSGRGSPLGTRRCAIDHKVSPGCTTYTECAESRPSAPWLNSAGGRPPRGRAKATSSPPETNPRRIRRRRTAARRARRRSTAHVGGANRACERTLPASCARPTSKATPATGRTARLGSTGRCRWRLLRKEFPPPPGASNSCSYIERVFAMCIPHHEQTFVSREKANRCLPSRCEGSTFRTNWCSTRRSRVEPIDRGKPWPKH
jgi:hypothetical protein